MKKQITTMLEYAEAMSAMAEENGCNILLGMIEEKERTNMNSKSKHTRSTVDECDHNECDHVCTMKKAKHTPGPWVADGYDVWQNTTANRTYMKKVCTTIHTTADSALIAAAPEMLEALVELQALLSDDPKNGHELFLIKAAIAKAKGGAE